LTKKEGRTVPAKKGQRFTGKTKWLVWCRQNGRCGYCGAPIIHDYGPRTDDDEYGEAHHVVPVQSGGPNLVDNGVYLCYVCHEAVHGDGADYRNGAVPPKEYFPYFDG
jgi:5-methylcytosine-specific restriction endonuclease McrA